MRSFFILYPFRFGDPVIVIDVYGNACYISNLDPNVYRSNLSTVSYLNVSLSYYKLFVLLTITTVSCIDRNVISLFF